MKSQKHRDYLEVQRVGHTSLMGFDNFEESVIFVKVVSTVVRGIPSLLAISSCV